MTAWDNEGAVNFGTSRIGRELNIGRRPARSMTLKLGGHHGTQDWGGQRPIIVGRPIFLHYILHESTKYKAESAIHRTFLLLGHKNRRFGGLTQLLCESSLQTAAGIKVKGLPGMLIFVDFTYVKVALACSPFFKWHLVARLANFCWHIVVGYLSMLMTPNPLWWHGL